MFDFQQPYDRKNAIDFLQHTFLPDDFVHSEEAIEPEFTPQYAKKTTLLGKVSSLKLVVYEIRHHSENDPRVGLSRDAFRLLAEYGYSRALIFFTSKSSENYRFSLVTVELKKKAATGTAREYSNPRRYSFFLGPDCKVHTPQQYLSERIKDLDDLKGRFSIEVVNKEFFTRIALLFTQLTGGSRKIGSKMIDEKGCLKLPQTTDDTLKKEFAVRLIGRLIFCWFLKKKKSSQDVPLISEELLSSFSAGFCSKTGGYYHGVLEPLFFEVLNTPTGKRKKLYQSGQWKVIPFLNGGLFSPHTDDCYDVADTGFSMHINTLKVPDSWLKELLETFETYNFTIDENTPVDVELSIEPEMLGRIFENLLAEINPETGDTARKSTGSYYTPRPIVEYMVDESLKQYLITKTGIAEENIISLLSYAEQDGNIFTENQIETLIDALHTVKIIDPACGSGAFPMGILQKILLMLQKLDPDSKIWLDKMLANIPDPMYRKELKKKIKVPNYLHKLGIIRDCIFGVDIQPIAVEISKLRCFLSLIVDEKVSDDADNRGIEHLPNLEFKFVCANSLIGLPENVSGKTIKSQSRYGPKEYKDQSLMFEATGKIDELKKLRDEYLSSYGGEKKKIEEQFRAVQSEMFQHSLQWGGKDSQTTKLSQWNPFSDEPCSWFDSKWMFGIIGFDISIGNPPYVRADVDEHHAKMRKAILDSGRYETLWEKWDLYVPFIERGYKLLNTGGVTTMIVSDAFCHSKYAEKAQKWFLKNARIIRLDFCANLQIFDAAVHNLIYLFQHTNGTNHTPERHVHHERFGNVTHLPSDKQARLTNRVFFPEDTAREVFKCQSERLDEICYITIGMVVNSHEKLAKGAFKMDDLVQDIQDKKHPKKFVEGKHLGMWLPSTHRWLEWGTSRAPSLFRRPTFPEIYETPEKILVQRSPGPDPKCCFDDQHFCFTESTVAFIPWHSLEGVRNNSLKKSARYYDEKPPRPDLPKREELEETSSRFSVKYLLGVMNSSAARDFLRANRRSNIHLYPDDWKRLPIPSVTSEKQRPVERLVERILVTKQRDAVADVTTLEHQLDQMVYSLYSLTDNEIAIVEDKKG